MNRICLTVAFIILCMWSCNKETLEVSRPISSGIQPNPRLMYKHDSALESLEYRMQVSEAQLAAIKSRVIYGQKKLEVMNPQEPIQKKAGNPPE